jgi:hypothetical protein
MSFIIFYCYPGRYVLLCEVSNISNVRLIIDNKKYNGYPQEIGAVLGAA